MIHVYAFICHRLTNPLRFSVKHLLESEKSRVIIHIDQKVNLKDRKEIVLALGEHENLRVISREDSVDVRWGHFSQIQVMLQLMKEALNYDFNYFSLLSGDDMPIQPNSLRELNFEKAYRKGVEFIGYNPNNNATERLSIDYPNFMFKKNHTRIGRVRRYFYIKLKSRFYEKNLSHLPKLYKGSNWFTLTDKSVRYIFGYIENNPQYLESFKNSFCGDEVFFQTIIFNSDELKRNVYGLNKNIEDCAMGGRYVDWSTGPDYPRVLNESDVNKMKKSSAFFARKIRPDATKVFMEQFVNIK